MDALDYIKTITGLDFKKDQAPAHFNDPNSIALESIQPGVLNTLKENNIDVHWNDAEKIRSSILKLRSEVNDAKRLSGFNELRGVVVLSMTPRDKSKPIEGTTRATCDDVGYRMGENRGMVKVYVPEFHLVITNLVTLEHRSPKDNENLKKLFELCTSVWGPRDYMSKVKPGLIVDLSLPEPDNRNYGTMIIPNDGSLPEYAIQGSKADNYKPPSEVAGDPTKNPYNPMDGQEGIPEDPVRDNALNNAVDNRVDADNAKKQHISVNKKLLIGFTAGVGPQKKGKTTTISRAGIGGPAKPGFTPIKYPKNYPSAKNTSFYVRESDTYVLAPGGIVEEDSSEFGSKVLVPFPASMRMGNTTNVIHRAMLEPLKAMQEQSVRDGFDKKILTVISCHRRIDYQKMLWDNGYNRAILRWAKKNEYIAEESTISAATFMSDYPGRKAEFENSDAKAHLRKMIGNPNTPNVGGGHLSGLAVDFHMGYTLNAYREAWKKKHGKYTTDKKVMDNAYKRFMQESAIMKWLKMNASFYGFYNYIQEPWHWEFSPNDVPDDQKSEDLPGVEA